MKDKICALLRSTNRDNIESMISWMEKSDFFRAPASSKHHSAIPGGLAKHSISVYETLTKLNDDYKIGMAKDTIIITTILHDLCKANCYVMGKTGYRFIDTFPLGHGEKSIFIIANHIKLTALEALMIRWHMNAYDMVKDSKLGSMVLGQATSKHKEVVAIFLADYLASAIVEN